VGAKLSVLRACRRLLRPGGQIAFYTIFIPPGVSEADRKRVLALGDPPELASTTSEEELLRSAGFVDIEETDKTNEYLRTARGWYEARERHAEELREIEGAQAFADGQENRRKRIGFIEAGLQRRSLFVATGLESHQRGQGPGYSGALYLIRPLAAYAQLSPNWEADTAMS
jgi:hypothetical protein